MTQYVIQIQFEANGIGVGWLAKSFKVTEEYPVPEVVPPHRVQAILTNTESFDEIVAAYAQYGWPGVQFSYDEGEGTISCTGEYEHTWDIN
jgi:hypothetical protein